MAEYRVDAGEAATGSADLEGVVDFPRVDLADFQVAVAVSVGAAPPVAGKPIKTKDGTDEKPGPKIFN
jgi:hypothetical protein